MPRHWCRLATAIQAKERRRSGAESDVVLHDQSKSDVDENEKEESMKQDTKGDEDQEVMKGLELLSRVEGKHVPVCAFDECLRYKSKLSPIPDRRTDRPRRTERVKKLYLDTSGKLSTPSIYHNFQYYVLGVTDEGYMIVGGMTFRDQVLFMIGRMFESLGGAPLAVQVDPAGELNSKLAESHFTHRETRVDVTQLSEHWRNGRPERRHS